MDVAPYTKMVPYVVPSDRLCGNLGWKQSTSLTNKDSIDNLLLLCNTRTPRRQSMWWVIWIKCSEVALIKRSCMNSMHFSTLEQFGLQIKLWFNIVWWCSTTWQLYYCPSKNMTQIWRLIDAQEHKWYMKNWAGHCRLTHGGTSFSHYVGA